MITLSILIAATTGVSAQGIPKELQRYQFTSESVCETKSDYNKMIRWLVKRQKQFTRELYNGMKDGSNISQSYQRLKKTFSFPDPNFTCYNIDYNRAVTDKTGFVTGWACYRLPEWQDCKWTKRKRQR